MTSLAGVAAGSKERIEAVAADILARRGYNGMGLKALSDAADLPYGSIYHHFPGGKEEIAAAAITSVGDVLGRLLDALFSAESPDRAVRTMFDYMVKRLADSDWSDGCPVGTPAQDGADDSAVVRDACSRALVTMVDAVARGLAGAGVKAKAAHHLASTLIATYEGATMLAKVQRSAAPLDAARDTMVGLVRAAVTPNAPPPA